MKRLFRLGIVLFIALLVIAPMATTQAQGAVCLPGLKQADCDLLTAAGKGSITSFTMDYAVNLKVTGLEGVKSGSQTLHDITLDLTGNGPLSIDLTKLPKDFKQNDPSSYAKAVAALTMGNVFDLAFKNGLQAQAVKFEFRIIDSKFYLKSDDPSFYSGNKNLVGKWLVMPLDEATLKKYMGNNAALAGTTTMGAGNDAQMQALGKQLVAIPGFISAKRSDANKEATFAINVNIAALLKSKEFQAMLPTLMKNAGSSSQVDPKQVTAMMAVITPFFQNLKITINEVIGTQDKLLHSFSMHLTLGLTPEQITMLAGLAGNSGDSVPTLKKPLNVDFSFKFNMTDLNQPITLETPADAQPIGGTTQQ